MPSGIVSVVASDVIFVKLFRYLSAIGDHSAPYMPVKYQSSIEHIAIVENGL